MTERCPACGQVKPKRPRSVDDHRRFFGVINAAFKNWPEHHDFNPDSPEHLRAWLVCKAGYRDTVTIPVDDDDARTQRLVLLAVEAAVRAANAYAFVRPHGAAIAVFTAKSIKFDTLHQSQFGALRQAVEEIIEAEIGVDAETLLKGVEQDCAADRVDAVHGGDQLKSVREDQA